MHFQTRAFLDGTVDEVERAMLDPRYLDYLLQHHEVLLEVQLLERKEPGPVEWFAFVEESSYDRTRRELRFTNVPTTEKINRLLVNTGTLRLAPAGSRCERVMEGEIKLSLPF